MPATITITQLTSVGGSTTFYKATQFTVTDPSRHIYKSGSKICVHRPVAIELVLPAGLIPVTLTFVGANADRDGSQNFDARGLSGQGDKFVFNARKLTPVVLGVKPSWKLFIGAINSNDNQQVLIDPDFENTDEPPFRPAARARNRESGEGGGPPRGKG